MDIPIELQADRVPPQLLGLNSYDKPSVGLQLLREEILGHDAFDDAFRAYIRRWAYKHPAPADFFRTMEDVGGHRLDWFWREFWLNNYHFDQAIDTVVVQHRGDTDNVVVRTRIALAACCRSARASRSATGRRRISTIRPRCGAPTPRGTCGAIRSPASTSRGSSWIRTTG